MQKHFEESSSLFEGGLAWVARSSSSRRFRSATIGALGAALVVFLAPGHMSSRMVVTAKVVHASRWIGDRHIRPVLVDLDGGGAEDDLVLLAQSDDRASFELRTFHSGHEASTLAATLRAADAATRPLSLGCHAAEGLKAARCVCWVVMSDTSVALYELDGASATLRWEAAPSAAAEPAGASDSPAATDATAGVAPSPLSPAAVLFVGFEMPGGGATVLAALRLGDGSVVWRSKPRASARSDEAGPFDAGQAGPHPQPTDLWQADPRFWGLDLNAEVHAAAAEGRAFDLELLLSAVPFTWASHHDTAVSFSEAEGRPIVVLASAFGVEATFEDDGSHAFHFALPRDALVADMDGDGAVEAVRVVDSRTAAPPRARTRDEAGAALPACVGVATRGYPAVETRFETALCHDDGVDRDVEAGRRRARGPAAAYSTRWLKKIEGATPVACPRRGGDAAAPRLGPGFDGAAAVDRRRWPAVDAIFAVSRGIVTRVGADGEHLWQTRGAPTWAHPQEGHVFMSLNDTVVVVSGATSIALLSAADGHVLADLRLPTNWDDEALAAPPVLRGGLIVASTQFATYVLAIDRRLVGRATARFAFAALLAAVAGLVALVVLLDD